MKKILSSLPQEATAPFCASEVQGSVEIAENKSFWQKLPHFLGPGLLVAVGYMDPGNWATDIEAGAKFGYNLLFVILLSSLAAILLQYLSLRVGIVSGEDLAQLCQKHYSKTRAFILWIFAEIAIIATDVAEVLGCALAFKLLLGCSLKVGIVITAFDTLIVLGLKGKGFRRIEAIILGLVVTIGLCYAVELWLIKPFWPDVWRGFIPDLNKLPGVEPWYLAIGILGATVMPHNLYLHSSIVQTRKIAATFAAKKNALQMNTIDTVVSLSFAFFVNAAILILAAAAFHKSGNNGVTEIDEAFRLLNPIVGSSLASIFFAIALLAAGQSSTFTGTIAGQVIMEGFLNLKIPCWKRRLITRGLALIPAFLGVSILGDHSTGKLLVLSQVVLSFQLPFVIFPLISFASNRAIMTAFTINYFTKISSWVVFFIITIANIWLLYKLAQ